ncbi:hypothetical protein DN475_24035 [Burkholderia multivorans]|nr:hypothetical protein DN475_24035 [Burkholderia multivorans]
MVFIAVSPTGLLTSWSPHIFVASRRPLAGASHTANRVPCVVPPDAARGLSPRCAGAPSGMALFVSGMYRNNGRTPPAIVKRSEAMAGKG